MWLLLPLYNPVKIQLRFCSGHLLPLLSNHLSGLPLSCLRAPLSTVQTNAPFLSDRLCDAPGEMLSLAYHLICILHKLLYLNLVGLLNMHLHGHGKLHTQAGVPDLSPVAGATVHAVA